MSGKKTIRGFCLHFYPLRSIFSSLTNYLYYFHLSSETRMIQTRLYETIRGLSFKNLRHRKKLTVTTTFVIKMVQVYKIFSVDGCAI